MMRRGGVLAAVALVLGTGLGLAPVALAPSGAADAPALAVSTTAAAVGDPIVVTLSGCTGAAPKIGRTSPWTGYVPGGALEFLVISEVAPGTWQTVDAHVVESDNLFVGRCADGSETPPVRVDVEWREMFTDPFYEQPGDALAAVVGTDCDPPAVVSVHFRVGERTWAVHPTVDARGDWRAVPPVIPRGRRIGIVGRCDDFRYIPTAWTNGGPKPMAPSNVVLDPGEGRPGTAFTGKLQCPQVPTVDRYLLGDDVVTSVAVAPTDVNGEWAFHDRARSVDARYSVTCGATTDRLRFDALTQVMRFGPAGLAVDGFGYDPTTIEGTDCDAGRTVTVEAYVGFRPVVVLHPATDEFGDWSVPLPADALRLGILVNASCGDDFDYETLERNEEQWRTTTTTAVPSANGPAEAAPAVPRPGSPSFTG